MPQLALIVDDDAPTRFVYARVLAALGFETAEASDGDEAVTALSQMTPTLILLDLLLPNRPGTEILDMLYADGRFTETWVIVISAQNQHGLELRPHDLFLLKPVLPQQLRDLVRSAVG